MHSLIFYVPESHVEEVKNALFIKGAGRYNKYDCCSWQVRGEGQFRPLEGSKPFLGETDKIEKVSEFKVEMIVEDEIVKDVIAELILVHPYEEVAYFVHKVSFLPDL